MYSRYLSPERVTQTAPVGAGAGSFPPLRRDRKKEPAVRKHPVTICLAVLLCLCLAAGTVACAPSSLPTGKEPPSASPVSDGAPQPFPGSGTADDPFLLSSAADLRTLSARVNGGDNCKGLSFLLTCDADLGDTPFSPIGACYAPNPAAALPFAGFFDGGGHTVTGLRVAVTGGGDFTTTLCAGLFGYVSGAVTRLSVSGASVSVRGSGNVAAGGLVGYLTGTVTQCSSDAVVSATSTAGEAAAGGLAGQCRGEIAGCLAFGSAAATASATLRGAWVGGLAGYSCGQIDRVFADLSLSVLAASPSLAFGGAVLGENGGTVSSLYYAATGFFAGLGQPLTTSQLAAGDLIDRLSLSGDFTAQDGQYPRFAGAAVRPLPSSAPAGSAEAPIVLSDAAGLRAMRADRCYALGEDIVLSGTFTPLAVYYGSLDGRGHSISGLSVQGKTADAFGLFGVLCGSVGDLTLAGTCTAENASGGYAGLLAGRLTGTVCGVTVSGSVTNTSRYTNISGGLAGQCRGGLIENCSASVSVSGRMGTVLNVIAGGLVGENSGTLRACRATGDCDATSTLQYAVVGGLVGSNTGTVTDCEATGNATALSYGEFSAAGGFVGQQVGGRLLRCVASGNATARADDGSAHAGGFAGVIRGGSVLASVSGGTAAATAHPAAGCHVGRFAGSGLLSPQETGYVTSSSAASAATLDGTDVPVSDTAVVCPELTAAFFAGLGFDGTLWRLSDGALPSLA